jgi:hypothetical protein
MTETTKPARIRWEETSLGEFAGRVGTLRWLAYQMRPPAYDGGRWQLTSYIPGSIGKCTYSDDKEEAQAEAERRLEEFISSLGATFPGGHPDGNAIEAYCATSAGDGDGRHLVQYAVRLPDGTTTAYGDQSWVSAGLGARDSGDGASTVVRDIWVSYGPWRTHETSAPGAGKDKT